MLKRLPVIIRFSDTDIKSLDLQKELRIDRSDLDRELARQPQRYNYWSELYATISAKVSRLREELEHLEARLYIQAEGNVTEKKHRILLNPVYRKKQKRLRHWESAERQLKFAEKSFDQRLSSLMCLNANQRKERQNLE
jgi:hypothetical protein